MAAQLVEALAGDFDLSRFRDEYRECILDLVTKKARGEAVAFKKMPPHRPEVVSFTDILKKSLRRVKKERKIA